jgi:hypothetical protein
LGSEPGDRFTFEPSNSIVERAADDVDVIGDSDRQRGLSAATPSLRRHRVGFHVSLSAPWGAVDLRRSAVHHVRPHPGADQRRHERAALDRARVEDPSITRRRALATT